VPACFARRAQWRSPHDPCLLYRVPHMARRAAGGWLPRAAGLGPPVRNARAGNAATRTCPLIGPCLRRCFRPASLRASAAASEVWWRWPRPRGGCRLIGAEGRPAAQVNDLGADRSPCRPARRRTAKAACAAA
jgi:hypothetical protein